MYFFLNSSKIPRHLITFNIVADDAAFVFARSDAGIGNGDTF